MSTRVITGKARLSFPHLFQPYAMNPDDKAKYSTMVLIPKSDTATYERLRAAEAEAKENDKARWNGKIPTGLKSSIHDGDDPAEVGPGGKNENYERFPERRGHWYFTTNSSPEFKPGVVDRNVSPIIDPSEVYSGVYAKVSVTAFGYNTRGNMGVGLGLNNVQILGGGDRLGGGVAAASEFDVEEEESLI